jgi:hypothetical protein
VTCIDDKTMYEIMDGGLTGPARRAALQHIRECEKCAARMRVLVGLQETLGDALTDFWDEQCPAPEVLHAYMEDTLPSEERAETAKHIKACTRCSLVLEEASWLLREYTREEEILLRSNRERLGSQLYERVQEFLKERFSEVAEIVKSADMYLYLLKPVPVFRGGKPAERREEPLPVVCRSNSVVVVVTGREPKDLQLRLVDEKGQEVAVGSCSAEGIATFEDVPAGYYAVELVEPSVDDA